MKIAILSDIHGNYEALKTCIEYSLLEGIDNFIFLGDYVGDLAYPQKTMNMLYDLDDKYHCTFIKGNREDYWPDYKNNGGNWNEYDSTTGSLYYTFKNLTNKDLLFFQNLSHTKEIHINGFQPFTICHGSPNRANEMLLPNESNTFSIMENNKTDIIVCGHTHIQGEIKHEGKIIIDAGSVGMPVNGVPKAQFVILESYPNGWKHTFIALPYDADKIINDLDESGLSKKAPSWCKVTKNLLKTGNNSHGSVLSRAMKLCQDELGSCQWPNIPEEYWEQALIEMIGN